MTFMSLVFRVPDSKFNFPTKQNAKNDTHAATDVLYYTPQERYYNISISVEALLLRTVSGFKNKCHKFVRYE
jgi:hypothetical protein